MKKLIAIAIIAFVAGGALGIFLGPKLDISFGQSSASDFDLAGKCDTQCRRVQIECILDGGGKQLCSSIAESCRRHCGATAASSESSEFEVESGAEN